jgi:predicted DsbA family dithiol-disulfide isomerase
MRVEIWSDVVCPWCYIAKTRFDRALESFVHRDQVAVVYRSFELDPSAPSGETTPTVDLLASKYEMTAAQAEGAQRQMEERAARDGLTFRMDRLRSGSTYDAHRLLHLAKDRGVQPQLIECLHRAYFTEQASVFDRSSLLDQAADAGLDRAEAEVVLAGDRYGDAVRADEATARSLGANGVPFFVIDRRYGISGAQDVDMFAQVLERAWAESEAA